MVQANVLNRYFLFLTWFEEAHPVFLAENPFFRTTPDNEPADRKAAAPCIFQRAFAFLLTVKETAGRAARNKATTKSPRF